MYLKGTPGKSCIIPVCHGTDVMHGKVFFSYLQHAADMYEKAHIVLADTLDVHNMVSSPDLVAMALETATALGDKWLRKHEPAVREIFKGNVTFARWDDVKADETFAEKYKLAKQIYAQNGIITEWVDKVCRDYAQVKSSRLQSQGWIVDVNELFQRSVNYMIEEIAGSSVYFNWYKAPAVYPGQYFDNPDIFSKVGLPVPSHTAVIFESMKEAA